MTEEKRIQVKKHNLILEDRKNLTLTGISDVDTFDEQTVVLFTDLGELSIKGKNLHIKGFSVDTGELSLEGEIESLSYTDNTQQTGGLFSKLFR